MNKNLSQVKKKPKRVNYNKSCMNIFPNCTILIFESVIYKIIFENDAIL